jgi:hypothetical protein
MKDFSALRVISWIFKLSGVITLAVVILALFSFPGNENYLTSGMMLLGKFSISVIGILIAIFQFAISEIILLFLQIEINTRHQQINTNSEREQWRCNNCGHEQSIKFDFCPKCNLDDYGFTEMESRKNRLKKEVEDEQYREKIRVVLGGNDK